MESKILKLTIKRQWFDLINSGVKIEEYREIKPSYMIKFFHNFFAATLGTHILEAIKNNINLDEKYLSNKIEDKYSHVEFYNGGYFSKKLPHSKLKIEKITIGEGREEWGAVPGVQYFIIHLGEKE